MTTQDNPEVNNTEADELDEVLTASDLENPESNDVGDAIVEDPENAPAPEETETPTESSTEEQPADEESPEGDDEGDESDPEALAPKPVPGETPREKALREEVTRVKRKLRQERGAKMFTDVQIDAQAADLTEEEQEFLQAVDPVEAANVEKLIAISAKKLGFVKKDEFAKQSYHDQAQSVLDEFLEKHPEYDEASDPDGTLWGQFQREYSQYKTPSNPKDLNRLFSRIHKDIFGVTTDNSGLKKVEAQKEKVKVASHSASAGGTHAATESKTVDTETKQLVDSGALKGFDDEMLKEMGLK